MCWGRSKNSTFSEYGYVVYQIKGDDACNNLVANMTIDTPSAPGLGLKDQHIFSSPEPKAPSGTQASNRPHFQTLISLKPAGYWKSNFIWSIIVVGERLQ